MKPQTPEEIRKESYNENEALAAMALYELLKPALKVKRDNGRFDLAGGDKTIVGLYRSAKRIIENEPRMAHKIIEDNFTRVNSDSNGNPRYVIHFLSCCPESWKNGGVEDKYQAVIKLMRKIGGGKFHNRQYGGGIVFQSYSLPETINAIERMISEVDK